MILTDRVAARKSGEAQEEFKKNEDIRLSPESIAAVRAPSVLLVTARLTRFVSPTSTWLTRIDLPGRGSLIVSVVIFVDLFPSPLLTPALVRPAHEKW